MGCGCQNQPPTTTLSIQSSPSEGGCNYSESQLREWKRLLSCSRTTQNANLLGVKLETIDSAIQVVDSALNVIYNPCYYQTELDSYQGLIFQILNAGICR